jgi:AmmeMemoRadiSam system protein A
MTLLDAASRENLLARARAAISRAIGAELVARPQSLPGLEPLIPEDVRAGVFVTLRINGSLRGCIGYPEAQLPLIDLVERCAVSAAISDPRFLPVTIAEWKEIDLEISVLGPMEVVGHISEIEVGRHGLVVEFGRRRGLLLPQVATEWQWDAREFASQTCVKAGLPRDAWEKGATVYRFEAEVFGETG